MTATRSDPRSGARDLLHFVLSNVHHAARPTGEAGGTSASIVRRPLSDLRQPQAREPHAGGGVPAGARRSLPDDRVLRVRGQPLGGQRLEPGDPPPAGREPHAGAALHAADRIVGLVPVRDRALHAQRPRRHLGRRVHLRPFGVHAEPAGQPPGRPGPGRGRRALPRRAVPRDLEGLGRLAGRRHRPADTAAAAQQGGHQDRRGLPGQHRDRGRRTTPAIGSCSTSGASTASSPASPRGARRRGPGRHDGVHPLAVQPGHRPPDPHVGRSARRRRRAGVGLAGPARPSLRPGPQGGAVHADHRHAAGLEPGPAAATVAEAGALPHPARAGRGPPATGRCGGRRAARPSRRDHGAVRSPGHDGPHRWTGADARPDQRPLPGGGDRGVRGIRAGSRP